MSEWKESTVYRLEGSILTQGSYMGWREDGEDSSPTSFTPDIISMLHRNAKTNIPFVVDHSGNTPVGYTFKVGVPPSFEELLYEGFIFDEQGIKALGDGYSYLSPKIEFVEDGNGNIIDAYIQNIALVKDPAIDGTGIRRINVAFSKPKEDTTMADDTKTEDVQAPVEQKEEIIEEVSQPPTDDSNPTMADILTELREMKSKYTDLESKYKEVASSSKKATAAQVETLRQDVKALGYDVDDAIKGLPDNNKIAFLNSLKRKDFTKGNLIQQPELGGKGAPGPVDKTKTEDFTNALSIIGCDMETYLELTKRRT